jgi:hypothetical protein
MYKTSIALFRSKLLKLSVPTSHYLSVCIDSAVLFTYLNILSNRFVISFVITLMHAILVSCMILSSRAWALVMKTRLNFLRPADPLVRQHQVNSLVCVEMIITSVCKR